VWALTPPGLVASLDPARLPVSAAARIVAARNGRPAWEHALTDGEDYELLFVVRARGGTEGFAARWARRFRTPLHCIGQFARKLQPGHVHWESLHGYEHLR